MLETVKLNIGYLLAAKNVRKIAARKNCDENAFVLHKHE